VKLSVIVPVLNEAARIAGLLDELKQLASSDIEVVIADGGSNDGCALRAQQAGFTVVRSSQGRARQMNAGAAMATGDVLLFLHADTRLPAEAHRYIARALHDAKHVWGRFDVRIEGRAFMLPIVSRFMNLRSRLTGIATGDQAIFLTRIAFERVGSFPDQPLMEDIELSKRLLAHSRPACIAHCAITSGRRWEANGVWRTILLMWRLRWDYWRGVPVQRLARDYQ
jgi:rSAM/selenodomain-associated transferase 2